MNKWRALPVAMLATGLSACIPASRDPQSPQMDAGPPISGPCNAGPVQRNLGKTLDVALGETMRREAGGEVLRTAPEGSPITMDYNAGRLNIFYDSQRKIVRINCG
jgi:hypothetical protein